MAGTMEGLGVPLFGGYTSYQSDGTSSYLVVNSDGTHDFTFTDEGADNFIGVTITDATTISSGYLQAFYTSITQSGGSADQINAFAADITLGGTCSSEISGVYIYFAETGTAVFGGIFSGYTVFFTSFASATPPAYRAGFHCYSQEPTATNASGLDAGLLVESAGASGTWGALLGYMGVTPPEYFLYSSSNIPWGATTRMCRILGSDAAGTAQVAAQLRVKIYETEYFIALYPTTCS